MFERRSEKVGEDGNEIRRVEMMVELFLEADGVVFGYCGKFIGQGLLLEHCYIIIGGNSIRLVYASGWNCHG